MRLLYIIGINRERPTIGSKKSELFLLTVVLLSGGYFIIRLSEILFHCRNYGRERRYDIMAGQ